MIMELLRAYRQQKYRDHGADRCALVHAASGRHQRDDQNDAHEKSRTETGWNGSTRSPGGAP
jgi:hypothetical protein